MRAYRLVLVCVVMSAIVGGAAPAAAQATTEQELRDEIARLRAELERVQKEYADRLTALEEKLAALEAATTAAQPVPPQAPPPQPSQAAAKIFNPDIAAIGDFLGAAGRNTVAPPPALEMHESEVAFQAAVDPYARADFFLSFAESGVDLEEGFITFPTVPGGLLVRVGKMRASVGKVNMMHNHVLPWTDRPLVTTNLLGGEDGINDAGISAAWLIPNRWLFLEVTGQVFRGDSPEVFRSRSRGDLSYVGHFRGYRDVTENTNLDVGFSYARGHEDVPPGIALVGDPIGHVYGIDATVRWRPLQRSIYRSFVGRSEWFWRNGEAALSEETALGWYVSADYQFARRWFAGARVDRSARATGADLVDHGQSGLLTFWPSEFSQLRGQYRRTKYAAGEIANEFLFQVLFSIGAHGAHPF